MRGVHCFLGMKHGGFLIPGISFLVMGTWIGMQQRTIRSMESETSALRDSITVARLPPISTRRVDDQWPIDWGKLANNHAFFGFGVPGKRARLELQRNLQHRSAEELMLALDGIIASDLPMNRRVSLMWMVIEPLVQLEPEDALNRYFHTARDSDGHAIQGLAVALQLWAKKDPYRAIEWFEKELKAGTFVGNQLEKMSSSESVFEAHLMSGLVVSDPAASRALAAKLPADTWLRMLSKADYPAANPENFISLVRTTIPSAADQAEILSKAAGSIAERKGYDELSRFITLSGASPAEQAGIVGSALHSYKRIETLGDMREMRNWALLHAPDQGDSFVGISLSYSVANQPGDGGITFAEACAIAAENRSDALLAEFLESHTARAHPVQARDLAALISDEELRKKILEALP